MKSAMQLTATAPSHSRARRSRPNRPSRSGGILWLVLLLIGILGSSGYAYWRYMEAKSASPSNQPVLQSVMRGPFDHIVLEQGEIESSSNVEVKCEVKGKGTSGTPILWVIDEGTYVKNGEELVKLDSSQLENDLKSQRITLSAAEALVISSEAAVKQAIIARQEYLEGTYLTERKAILSEIAVAEQDLRKAELSLASAERLAAKGTLKSLQIEAEQFAVQNARNKLDAAEGRLKVLDELTKAKMLVQFDSDIETKKAKLDSDKNTLEEEKSKLDEIQSQIEACTIRSPTDGQVVYANKFSSRGGSEFVVEAGAIVREQQTIIVLPDPTQMQVKAKINESRITLVREGMPSKIKVNAVQGDLLGQVTKVNKYAEPGSWFSSAVKDYATFVKIDQPPETIRTGMTAEVRIFVEQIDDALQIPVLGVYEMKGHYFVLVPKGKEWETREIQVGATNDKNVTVLKGLAEGEQVVLNPRNHLDLMELPEIEESEEERKKISEMSKAAAAAPAAGGAPGGAAGGGAGGAGRGPGAAGAGGPGAGGRGAGGPGGPGAGGPAMSPDAIAGMAMQRSDTNSDGKITKDEAEGSEMLKRGFDETDTNKDGAIDRSEMAAAIKKRMDQAGAGGGRGPGGPGGG